MKKDKYMQDLAEIREIMQRSSRFISLSGWSGISAGTIGLLGAGAAYFWVFTDAGNSRYGELDEGELNTLLLLGIATLTLILSAGLAVFFTSRLTRKRGEKIWDYHAKKLLQNLGLPLIIGGLVCLILLFNGNFHLVTPLTLVFYGLALINASKYTLPQIRSLGILETILGISGLLFPGISLYLWAVGFGLLHIIYGIILPNKLKS